MKGPFHSVLASVSSVSHLIEAEPTQPGTISRAGPPWRCGRLPVHLQRDHRVGSIAFQIGWLRMKSGACGVGGRRSFGTTPGRRPGPRQPQDVGEPDAHHDRGADGAASTGCPTPSACEAPAVAAYPSDRVGDLLHPPEVVEPQGQRVLDLAGHLQHVLRRVDLGPVVVVAHEEGLVRGDVARQLPEGGLQVDGAGAPDE
jgi:hypothetical protein